MIIPLIPKRVAGFLLFEMGVIAASVVVGGLMVLSTPGYFVQVVGAWFLVFNLFGYLMLCYDRGVK
ncbi:hypothetical protein [Marinobacterium litorale]|uniref:hypothetical protein n=1 Tax=Marinobacterium litorale TaxID=404770 RepID=UPI0004835A9A|nr:hypothetical protein [Marinobacterium litorale]